MEEETSLSGGTRSLIIISSRHVVNVARPGTIKRADNRIREAYTGANGQKIGPPRDPWMMVVNGKFGGRRLREGGRSVKPGTR